MLQVNLCLKRMVQNEIPKNEKAEIRNAEFLTVVQARKAILKSIPGLKIIFDRSGLSAVQACKAVF